jgi:outer membrane protein assembly factor BamB
MTTLTRMILIACALCLMGPSSSPAEGWPMDRGQRTLSGSVDDRLDPPLSIAWSFATGGPIKASAVVAEGHVFVGSDDGSLYALGLSDGMERWRYDAAAVTTGALIEAPPLVHDDAVYVGDTAGIFHALDAKTGRLLWRYETDDKILAGPTWARSPIDGRAWVIVGSYDAHLHCLDAQTGELVWKQQSGNYINATAAVLPGPPDDPEAGRIVYGGCDGDVWVLRLVDGSVIGRVRLKHPIIGAVAVDAERSRAYLGHYGNRVVGIDLPTLTVLWRFRERSFPFYAAPALSPDGRTLIVAGHDQRVRRLDPKTGEQAWSFRARDKLESSPILVGSTVIAACEDGYVYALDAQSGDLTGRLQLGPAIHASPAYAEGMVLIGSDDGRLYALRGLSPEPNP